MNWTDNPIFLVKYAPAEKLRMGNVRAIPTPLMARSLAKVFRQLKEMGAHPAMEVRIPQRPTPYQRRKIRAQLRKDLQRSIKMLEAEPDNRG